MIQVTATDAVSDIGWASVALDSVNRYALGAPDTFKTEAIIRTRPVPPVGIARISTLAYRSIPLSPHRAQFDAV